MRARTDAHVYVDARRHGIVLVRPLGRALVFAALGALGFAVGPPASFAGAVLLLAAGVLAFLAVWSWDRVHVVVTDEEVAVVGGVLRRRARTVRLAHVRRCDVDQSLLGRLLGYGTVVAGDLELPFVPRPRELCRLVQSLAD